MAKRVRTSGSKQSARQQTLPGMAPAQVDEARSEVGGRKSEKLVPTSDLRIPTSEESCGVPTRKIGPPPKSLAGKTVYVVDSNSLIHQVFHALPEMKSPRGEPVGAVFGFTRDILNLLEEKKPDYLFCAFDLSGPTFRHELFDSYKIHRAETDDDLVPQFALIRRVLEAMGVPVLQFEGFEADDVLATVAQITESLGGRCLLVTGDKDCRQLITDRVQVYNIRKDLVFDAAALEAEWGIRPDQVVDFQTLVGDSVDNIPGVPLIGPKLARELLEKYGTLEGVLDHAGEVSGERRRQNLLAARGQALISRQLVRLRGDVPVAIDWEGGSTSSLHLGHAAGLFREFGFRTLANKYGEMAAAAEPQRAAQHAQATYHVVGDAAALEKFATELAKQKQFALHLLLTNELPRWGEILGLAFRWTDNEAHYLPLAGSDARLDADSVWSAIRGPLEDPDVEILGHNVKQALVALAAAGVSLRGVKFDAMLADYLLEAGERTHGLNDLSRRYLDREWTRPLDQAGKPIALEQLSTEQAAGYAGEAAVIVAHLRTVLVEQLQAAKLESLFCDVETPLESVLADLEATGIKIDVPRLETLSDQYTKRIATLEAEIHEIAGRPFNIGSPKQLAQVLFDELKLPAIKKTSGGAPSTDAEVLEELAVSHALPAKIIEYRQYAKLQGTYVDALPRMVHPTTGRVHASLHQAVAATGRLSSSDPNLQNIPIRTEAGREIRSAIVPGEKGWQLLAADYSQIELRVLAHFSGDEALSEAFARDEDIHTRVAAEVFHVEPEKVTSAMRRGAKAVNFGIIYGQSPFGLAKALSISQEEAARFIDAYFDGYPGVEKFLVKTLADCRQTGYVYTILGRRRAIRGIRSESTSERPNRHRNLPEREAINSVIQGSAADLIKLAMIHIHRRLEREKLAARMLLQIHDELLFEVPSQEVGPLAKLVADEMADVMKLSVPLKVDVKTGRNWAECEPI